MNLPSLTLFDQSPYRCRLDWGELSARLAAERGDIVVVVDVLRFTSAVITAIQSGCVVYPCRTKGEVDRLVQTSLADGFEITEGNLSPLTYLNLPSGSRFAVASPNGAACTLAARSAPYLFAGGLLNASALAECIAGLLKSTRLSVTVIACGERGRGGQNDLPAQEWRPAIEDYLGAGAILSQIPGDFSPEAQVCRSAFLGVQGELQSTLWDCASGREMRSKGLPGDVRHAARLDYYHAVPIFRESRFERWGIDR